MKKLLLPILTLPLSVKLMAETVEEPSDTSKVYDIDEVVIISQPKVNFRLRQQPISAMSFGAEQMNQLGTRGGNFAQRGNPIQVGVDVNIHF